MGVQTNCAKCGQSMLVQESDAGKQAKCPACSTIFTIQGATTPQPVHADQQGMMACPECAEKNDHTHAHCCFCGAALHGRRPPPPADKSYVDGVGVIIPYKNARALWSYYLAVFSLIPCLGIILGTIALIMGLQGLKFANEHPEAKGRAHAWTGIILGGICALAYVILTVVAIVAAQV